MPKSFVLVELVVVRPCERLCFAVAPGNLNVRTMLKTIFVTRSSDMSLQRLIKSENQALRGRETKIKTTEFVVLPATLLRGLFSLIVILCVTTRCCQPRSLEFLGVGFGLA